MIAESILPLLGCLLLAGPFLQAPVEDTSGWRLSQAPIRAIVREKILAELTKDSLDETRTEKIKDADGHASVKLVKLGNDGRMGIEVIAHDGWCGATGNCPVWIFAIENGDILVTDGGWDFGFRSTMHHGVFDFYDRANLSAGSGVRHEYQFDGKVYQQVEEIEGADY